MSKLKIIRPRHLLRDNTTGYCGARIPLKVHRDVWTSNAAQMTCNLCRHKLNVEAVTRRLKE